jgi:hypothetical protein
MSSAVTEYCTEFTGKCYQQLLNIVKNLQGIVSSAVTEYYTEFTGNNVISNY